MCRITSNRPGTYSSTSVTSVPGLAQQAAAAGTGAFGGTLLHLAARQVLGQRLAARALWCGGRWYRGAGPGRLDLGGLSLQLLERQFELRDLVSQALGRLAELHAPQPGELGAEVLGLQRLVP